MTSFNTKYMINEYKSDLGITIKNLGVKIQTDAPHISSLYDERTGGSCGGGIGFKPRRLEAIFENGRRLLYPVPAIDKLDDFIAKLTPGLIAGATPGNAGDEAICLNLLGEEWGMVPPSIGSPKQADAYNVVLGSIKKEAVNYKYKSDVTKIGEVRLSFAFQKNWVEDVIKCQKTGLDDPNTSASICTAGTGIKPRKLIMSTSYNNTQSFRGKSTGSRDVPVSIITSIKETAGKIENCSRCIGYVGETIPNVQLYYGGGII